jgi:hypothetical protein
VTYIVVTRNPSNNRLIALMDEDDGVMAFKSHGEAYRAALTAAAFEAWGFEVIEVESI